MMPLFALLSRTMREHSRARSTFIARAAIAAIVLLILWMVQSMQGYFGAPGKTVFAILITLNYAFFAMATLTLGASAVAEEKEEQTLGLLRMANLSPVSILFGKGIGRVGILLLYLALQVPFCLLVVTLGGVSTQQVVTAFTLLAAFTFSLGAIALFFSVLCRRVWQATVLGGLFASMLFGVAGPFYGIARYLTKTSGGGQTGAAKMFFDAAEWIYSVNPFTHLAALAESSYLSLEVGRSVLAHGAAGIVFFLLAWAIFDKRADGGASEAVGRRWGGLTRMRLLSPKRPGRSPVTWRDFHFALGGRALFFVRLIAYLALALAPELWRKYPRPIAALADDVWSIGFTIFVIEAAVFATRAWGPEYWGKTLGGIVTTPLSMRRLHWEKAKAALYATGPSLLLMVSSLAFGWELFWRATQSSGNPGVFLGRMQWVQSIGEPTMLLICFLALCLNFSLRVRWAAIPLALGTMLLVYLLLNIATAVMLFSANIGNGFEYLFAMRLAFTLLAMAAVAVFAVINFHRRLIRLAAES